jgi:hypothetical protein
MQIKRGAHFGMKAPDRPISRQIPKFPFIKGLPTWVVAETASADASERAAASGSTAPCTVNKAPLPLFKIGEGETR